MANGSSIRVAPPRWWPSFAARLCAGALLSACALPPAPLLPTPEPLLTPRDSARLAYDTGRRDALLIHRPRTAAVTTGLALPLGLAISRSTGEYWAMPVTVTTVALGGTWWARRQTRRAPPPAPDSLRVRYGLDDVFLWSRYQRGFADALEQQRRTEYTRSLQTSALLVLVTGLTYYAFRPRD